MIRKGSPSERGLAKLLRETFKDALVIRSSGSLLVDLVFVTSKKTILFEVKSVTSKLYRFTKNVHIKSQFELAKTYTIAGFTIYYVFYFLKEWYFLKLLEDTPVSIDLSKDCIYLPELNLYE